MKDNDQEIAAINKQMNKEKKNVEYSQAHDFEKCNEIECDCDCKYCQNGHWE